MRRALCVCVVGLLSACLGARELEDSPTVTFEVENRTGVPLAFRGAYWLEIEREPFSLQPRGEVSELCDQDDPVNAFERLELPPEGNFLEPGQRFSYAWQTNAFAGWRCDPGWSDCSECQIAEPVPLGRTQMRICAHRTDLQCRNTDARSSTQPNYRSVPADCTSIDVEIGEEDRTVRVVIDTLSEPRCGADEVLEPAD